MTLVLVPVLVLVAAIVVCCVARIKLPQSLGLGLVGEEIGLGGDRSGDQHR